MNTKDQWDLTLKDFGKVPFNSTQFVTFNYLGDLNLTSSDFKVGCSCTSPTYNPSTKQLNVGLNVNIRAGIKQATVQCAKTGTTFILKAEVE